VWDAHKDIALAALGAACMMMIVFLLAKKLRLVKAAKML
jgi:hypothetical protein